jgi:endogenous inhibitor of DNA gyrase (YacG/DUF329 family)
MDSMRPCTQCGRINNSSHPDFCSKNCGLLNKIEMKENGLMNEKSHIADDLLDVLRNHLVDREYYINPNFLSEITQSINDYYEKEDDNVMDKIHEMYSW